MLDRDKADVARSLTGAASVSDVLDLALDRIIHDEQLRNDIAAYRRQPVTDNELALAELHVEFDLGDDDVDYEAIYGEQP